MADGNPRLADRLLVRSLSPSAGTCGLGTHMIKEQGAWDKGVKQQRHAVIAPTPDEKISDQGVVKAECPHMNPEDQFVPRCSPRRWASAP